MAREFAAYVRLLLSSGLLVVFLIFDAIGVLTTVFIEDLRIPGEVFWAIALVSILVGAFVVHRDTVGGSVMANVARDLTASDSDVRAAAMATLAGTRTEPAGRVLRNAVKHGLPDVRQHAAVVLAERSAAVDTAALLETLRDSPAASLRGRAVDALGREPTPEVVTALSEAIENDPSDEVRCKAIGVIGELDADLARSAAPALRAALGDRALYAVAAPISARLGDTSAVPLVIEHCRFDPEVAVETLVEFDGGAIDTLVELLGTADVADRALRRLPQSQPSLSRLLLDHDEPPDRRRAAASILGDLGADAIPNLIRALDDPEEAVGRTAADALSAQGEAAANHLVPLLHSDTARTRVLACEALAWRGNAAVVMPLCRVLRQDGDVEIQTAAANALGEIADPRAAPALLKAVIDGLLFESGTYTQRNDSRWPVRVAAIQAIGQLDSPEAAEALIPLYLTRHGELQILRGRIRDAIDRHDTPDIHHARAVGDVDGHERARRGKAVGLDDAVLTIETSITALERTYGE